MKIANISIKRPVFVTVIMIALTILGYTNYQKLVLNDMPNADIPYVSVVVTDAGATPQELETKVTKKVEDAIQKISGVDTITSTVKSGVSQTTVSFELSKDSEVAAQEVRDKISGIRGQLPTEVDDPVISKFDMSASSILSIAVYGLDDNQALSDIVDNTIKPKLYEVSGIGSIDASGEDTREIHIKLDNDKLISYGLTASQVVSAFKNDNIDQSTGKVVDGDNEISITTSSKIQKIEDFKNILIKNNKGTEIRLKDIGTIEDSVVEKTNQAYYQGNESIGIDITKQSGANTVEVAKNVKNIVNQIKGSLPQGVHVEVVSDNSESIQRTVDSVQETIIEGCALAIIIVFLFLNEWESTLISALSLPISIITFICMKLMNFSLNTMSLMGLSLAVGLLIDDAIVVIENIVRHLHMGKFLMEAAKDATSEIGFAVIATTSAVIAVFLPIAMVDGILGKYFIEFAMTIVFSMAVSLFVSFTLVPMMASKMLKSERKESKTFIGKFFKMFNEKFDNLSEKYAHLLVKALKHRLIILIACAIMLVFSIGLASTLGFAMMPTTDNSQITVSANFDSGITLDVATQKNKQFEEIIKSKYPEVKYMYSNVSTSSTSIKLELVDKQKRKSSSTQIAEKLREDLGGISGTEVTVSAASTGGVVGSSKDVTYNLVSDDKDKLQAFAEKVKGEMAKDPNARDVTSNDKAGTPVAKIDVDRDKAADLGVNSADVASTLSTLFNGSTVTKYDGGKDRYDVKLYLDEGERKNLSDLDGIYVAGTNNTQVPLTQVTKRIIGTTSSQLNRYGRQGQIQISCNVSGISSGTFQNKYLQKIKSELPAGVTLSLGGTNQLMQKSMMSLIQAIVLSILFLYLVMAAQFESFIDPGAIMFALPLAIIGALLGLFVFGNEITMTALIGIVMLMGLVSKNGILLIDATKERTKEGMPLREALKEAGLVRLRPIIMTTLAMIFGMLPSAVSTKTGSEMSAPMSQAIIGGLITATILTLVVVPIAYTLLDDLKRKFGRIKNKKTKKVNEEESNLNL